MTNKYCPKHKEKVRKEGPERYLKREKTEDKKDPRKISKFY